MGAACAMATSVGADREQQQTYEPVCGGMGAESSYHVPMSGCGGVASFMTHPAGGGMRLAVRARKCYDTSRRVWHKSCGLWAIIPQGLISIPQLSC